MKKYSYNFKAYLATGILFLTSLLVQVNLVYACQVMEQPPVTSCCCDEMPSDNGCTTNDGSSVTLQNATKACCQVDVGVTTGEKLSNTVSASPGKYDNKHLQAPPLLLPVSDFILSESSTDHYVSADYRPAGGHGTDTYLVTQRFRE